MKIPSTLDFVKNLQSDIRESDFHSFNEAQAQNLLSEYYCVEIISALEKQILKKPCNYEEYLDSGVHVGDCKICDTPVCSDWKFCPCCGQRLDWSGEE